VKDEAEPGAGPQHLAVLVSVIADVGEIDRPVVNRDPQGAAGHRERLIDPVAAGMSDHDVWAVTGHQAVDDRRREDVASPEPVAPDYDTHVQIIASTVPRARAHNP